MLGSARRSRSLRCKGMCSASAGLVYRHLSRDIVRLAGRTRSSVVPGLAMKLAQAQVRVPAVGCCSSLGVATMLTLAELVLEEGCPTQMHQWTIEWSMPEQRPRLVS